MNKAFNNTNTGIMLSSIQVKGRNIILLFSVLLFAACNNSKPKVTNDKNHLSVSLVNNPYTAEGLDTTAADQKPTMDFNDTLHNFGTMHQDETVEYDFKYTNNGITPLIITSASGSCGCTVPSFSQDPLPPGKSAVMKVTFSSTGKSGHQEKSITICNNTLRNIQTLYIQADIIPKK